VIPIVINNELIGVLDIDSPLLARFDDDDQQGLENLIKLFVSHYENSSETASL
jgi:GAF domain-containing protein